MGLPDGGWLIISSWTLFVVRASALAFFALSNHALKRVLQAGAEAPTTNEVENFHLLIIDRAGVQRGRVTELRHRCIVRPGWSKVPDLSGVSFRQSTARASIAKHTQKLPKEDRSCLPPSESLEPVRRDGLPTLIRVVERREYNTEERKRPTKVWASLWITVGEEGKEAVNENGGATRVPGYGSGYHAPGSGYPERFRDTLMYSTLNWAQRSSLSLIILHGHQDLLQSPSQAA